MFRSRKKESSALSWSPSDVALEIEPLRVEMRRFSLLKILQRVFLYHTLVTKIIQLCECMKVLLADYKIK